MPSPVPDTKSSCYYQYRPLLKNARKLAQKKDLAALEELSHGQPGPISRSDGGALVCRNVQRLDRSALFGTGFTSLSRTRSCEFPKPKSWTIQRACSASFDSFSDEEFSKKIQELALRFQLLDDESTTIDSESEIVSEESIAEIYENNFEFNSVEPSWPKIHQEPPDWAGRDEIIPASIERKANSVDLPLSLRIIKRKMQWQDGFREVGESALTH
ncbi:Signal transduction response regulator [Fagus crenata]